MKQGGGQEQQVDGRSHASGHPGGIQDAKPAGIPHSQGEEARAGGKHQPAGHWRIGDDEVAEDVGEDLVRTALWKPGRIGQRPGRCRDLVAHVLQAAQLQGFRRRRGRMVVELPADEGEVQAVDPCGA